VRIHSPQANGHSVVAVALWATPFLSATFELSTVGNHFACAFECEDDATWFLETLKKRLGKFQLEVAPEKTARWDL